MPAAGEVNTLVGMHVEPKLMGPAELPECLDLAESRRWNRDTAKWRLLFDVGEVYGVRDAGGALIGTTGLTRYDAGLAMVGMVLVAPEHGGRGVGRAMMDFVMAEHTAPMALVATGPGRSLYRALGFHGVGSLVTHIGTYAPTAGPVGSRMAVADDLPAIRALDRQAYGVDRSALLTRLFATAEQIRIVERDGRPRGFGLSWAHSERRQLGPVVAEDRDAARTLIDDLASGRWVRVDVDPAERWLTDLLAERGLTAGGVTEHMVHGRTELPGERAMRYAIAGAALG